MWNNTFSRREKIKLLMSIFRITLMTIIVILYVIMGVFFVEDYYHFSHFLWYPLLFSILWRLAIAVKYASFSKEEYDKVLSVKSADEINRISKQIHVGYNYVDIEDPDVIDFEIVAAGFRIGCEVGNCFLRFECPNNSLDAKKRLEEWKLFLALNSTTYSADTPVNEQLVTDDLQKQSDGSYSLSIAILCKRINRYSQRQALIEMKSFGYLFSRPLAVILALIPFGDFITNNYKPQSYLTIVFLVMATIEMYFSVCLVVGRFLLGAIIHQRRQTIIADVLNMLIRTSDYANETIYHYSSNSNNMSTRKESFMPSAVALAKKSDRVAVEHYRDVKGQQKAPAALQESKDHYREFNAARRRSYSKSTENGTKIPFIDGNIDLSSMSTNLPPTVSGATNVEGMELLGNISILQDYTHTQDYQEFVHSSSESNSTVQPNGTKTTSFDATYPTSLSASFLSVAFPPTTMAAPTAASLSTTHPSTSQPTTYHPSTSHPSTSHPTTSHPSTTHPSITHPTTTDTTTSPTQLATSDWTVAEQRRVSRYLPYEFDSEIDRIPRLSLTSQENIYSWLQARMTMQTFKLRFRKRK